MGSGLRELGLDEVELLFKLAKSFVADLIVIAQVEERGALDGSDFAGESVIALVLFRMIAHVAGCGSFEAAEAEVLQVNELVIDDGLELGRVTFTSGFEVGESSFDHGAAGLRFFDRFSADPARPPANERRKRESLDDERDEDYGKREKDNQITLGKG